MMSGMEGQEPHIASAPAHNSPRGMKNPPRAWGRFAGSLAGSALLVALLAAVAMAAIRLARGEALTRNVFLNLAQAFWIPCLALAVLLSAVVESSQWLFGRVIWMRRAALFGAQIGWRVTCVLHSGWFALALLYVTSATAVALRRAAMGEPVTTKWFFGGGVGPWVQCIALSALLAAVLEARSRGRQIVIAAFSNVTGDPACNALADGLPRRLMTNLSDIAEVYEHVSEDPADLGLETQTETPALSVDSASALSGLTASLADQKAETGFLKIPANWVINTLSAVIQGPRIIGSILKTADGMLIEASICGGRYQNTWRVKEKDVEVDPASKDPKAAALDSMISQLAYQVFTYLDQDQLGTFEWRAAERYTAGLRASIDAKREREGTGPRTVAVQRAQKAFFQAFREDNRFARSRYNLGVMYYSGRQFRPSYETFRSVIDDFDHEAVPRLPGTPGFENTREELAKAHYAAAKAARELGQDWAHRVGYHCQRAIDLNPSLAPAWNLLGLLGFEDADARASGYDMSSPFFARALGLSWNELCAATWAGKRRSAVLSRTVIHLTNLANSRIPRKRARTIMKQALALEPTSEDNWVALGKLCLAVRDFAGALSAFEAANREKDDATHWLWIACTQRLLEREGSAQAAWDRVRKSIGDELFQKDNVGRFWRALERTARIGHKPWDDSKLNDWKEATGALADHASNLRTAGEKLAGSKDETVDEAIAAVLPGRSTKYLIEKSDSDGEVRLLLPFVAQRILNDLSTQSQLKKTDPDLIENARSVVQKTVDARPTGPLERSLLARLYLLLQMPELAEAEARNALILDPANPDCQLLFCDVAWAVISTVTDKHVRSHALARIVGVFAELAATLTDNIRRDRVVGAGWAHYWLAVFSYWRLDYPTAQQGFETSYACGYQPFASLQWLCLVHFRCGAFEESESAYLRLKNLIAEMKPGDQLPPSCYEETDPRFQQAMAASHSAAAAAEQGLIRLAFERWRESCQLTKSLRQQKLMGDDDAKNASAAQLLCHGMIRLSAGLGLAGNKTDAAKRVHALRRAIFLLERTVQRPSVSALRADARYRIAVACAELARLIETQREEWLRVAGEQLCDAEAADWRDEYKDRIRKLRVNLTLGGAPPAHKRRARKRAEK